MYLKNKGSEKTGARARNTPFGAYCHALTNDHVGKSTPRIMKERLLFHSNKRT
uniref:Uncharacterized protein n=1 Tax=Candidatus Kentrum sp. SD TaxID=2126332 RepID=A0A450YDT1_9GAMM|nr:MAG: hypothetical protein BECKSD772F_GA0070984_101137 [Candidatus Kentron sp. SD]VFK39689.1 MAG: hypothetical protein BECKSD772E_GA0070983_10043 [Candidatus Kentron sp. SD]